MPIDRRAPQRVRMRAAAWSKAARNLPAWLGCCLVFAACATLAAADEVDPTIVSSCLGQPLTAEHPAYVEAISDDNLHVRVDGLVDQANRDVYATCRLVGVKNNRETWIANQTIRISATGDADIKTSGIPDDLRPGVYALMVDVRSEPPRGWNRFLPGDRLLPTHERAIVLLPKRSEIRSPSSEDNRWQANGDSKPTLNWQTVDALRVSSDGLDRLNRWMTKSRADLIPGLRQISGIQENALLHLPRRQHESQSVAVLQPGKNVSLNLVTAQGRLDPLELLSRRTRDEDRLHRATIRFAAGKDIRLRVFMQPADNPQSSHGQFTVHQTQTTAVRPVASPDTESLRQNGDPVANPSSTAGNADESAPSDRWEEVVYFVQPKNHHVELALKNLGEEEVLIDAVRLESCARDELPDAAEIKRLSENARDLFFRLGDASWMQSWTPDLDDAELRDVYAAHTVDLYRRCLALQRLVDLLRLHRATGVVLPSEWSGEERRAIMKVLAAEGFEIVNEPSTHAKSETDHAHDKLPVIATASGALEVQALRRGPRAVVDRNKVLRSVSTATSLQTENKSTLKKSFSDELTESRERTTTADRVAAMIGSDDGASGTAFGRNAWLDLQWLLTALDPDAVIVDYPAAAFPLDPRLTRTLADYRRLPKKRGRRLDSTTGLNNLLTVHVHDWTRDFTTNGSVDDGPSGRSVPVTDQVSKTLVSLGNLAPWKTRVKLGDDPTYELEPGSWKVIDIDSQAAELSAWTAIPGGGPALDNAIRWKVTQVVERIGFLDQIAQTLDGQTHEEDEQWPQLINGGFENDGQVGLSGWVHAQFPKGAVAIDVDHVVEGKRSMRMTNVPGAVNRTWIISEAITPPASRRLAVSAAIRGRTKDNSRPIKLRLTLEGNLHDEAYQRSTTIDVPNNGSWQPSQILLEVDSIDPATEQLRLAIDLLATGQVWIDDLQLHSQFPLQRERRELQRLAYLAVEGIRQENLTHAASLLQNHWSQVLLRRSPAILEKEDHPAEAPPRGSVLRQVSGHTEEVSEQDEKDTPTQKGVARRIRNWLPEPLRF